MDRFIRVSLALTLLLSAALLSAQEISWYRSLEEARAAAESQGKNLFVLVTAGEWCRPCSWVDEELLSEREIADRIDEFFIPLRLYDYQEEHLELPAEAYPSILVYDAEGTLLENLTGPPATPVLEAVLTRYEGGSPAAGEPRRFRTDRGLFVYTGGGSWERRVDGRSVGYREYDRDEQFIYLESEQQPRFLALPPGGGEMWQWDPLTESWEEFTRAQPE